MDEKEITQGLGNEDAIQCALKDYDLAKAALQRADAKELFRLYEKGIRERGALITTLEVILQEKGGAISRQQIQAGNKPDENSIAAIKEIALEAIALAKAVLGNSAK